MKNLKVKFSNELNIEVFDNDFYLSLLKAIMHYCNPDVCLS